MPSKPESKTIICHDVRGKAYQAPLNKVHFRPGVYGVIIRNGKILLSPQWDGYDFPGGGMEINETIEQALVREAYEETGYKVKIGKLVACYQSFFKSDSQKDYWNALCLYYTCTIQSGKISTAGFDENEKVYAKAAEWIDIKKALKLKYYNTADSSQIIQAVFKKYAGKK
jgi:8-oxo-dGTP diphosphatase